MQDCTTTPLAIINGTRCSREELLAAFAPRPLPERSRDWRLAKIEKNFRMGLIAEAERRSQIENL